MPPLKNHADHAPAPLRGKRKYFFPVETIQMVLFKKDTSRDSGFYSKELHIVKAIFFMISIR